MSKNQDGFTLIETIFMLFVISLLVAIPILSMDKMIESIQIDLFLREVTANITRMQNHAILNGESTQIEFTNKDGLQSIHFVVPENRQHPINKRIDLDSPYYQFKYVRSNYNLYIRYSHTTGNISKIGSITFETTRGNYDLTFWLGSGRFEIAKTSDK